MRLSVKLMSQEMLMLNLSFAECLRLGARCVIFKTFATVVCQTV